MPDKSFNNVTIEKIQRSDLDQLEKLFASAFSEEIDIEQVRRRIQRARQFYYILQPLSQFSAWIKNHFNVYVTKIAGRVVGFIQVSYLNKTQLHIDYIAFSKQYRGQGLGRWVLSRLLTDVADARQYDVVLEVRVDNRAYYFYRRLGFKQTTEILHYELRLGAGQAIAPLPAQRLSGFRELKGRDRAKLYRLYLEAVPAALRQVVKRTYDEFNPSMVVRHLEWAKNHLMRKRKKDFVVEKDGKIIAWLTINSYLRLKSHVISLIIHPDFETLRRVIVCKAVGMITASYHQGVVSTTIYSDEPAKQVVLEQLGFKKELAYYLMFRPAAAGRHSASQSRPGAVKLQPMAGKHFKLRNP